MRSITCVRPWEELDDDHTARRTAGALMTASKPRDPAWLREQIEAYLGIRSASEHYARFLKSILERACHQIDPLAWVSARAKSVPSFAEKCVRRGYQAPLEEMWDLCGARVVVNSTETLAHMKQLALPNEVPRRRIQGEGGAGSA